jgi:hypothetical protein
MLINNKHLWLYASEDGINAGSGTHGAPDSISAESLEPSWDGSVADFDPEFDAPAEETDETLETLEPEAVEADDDDGAQEDIKDDDDGIDPKALKAAQKKLRQEQMEAMLNDPQALEAHLNALKAQNQPPQNNGVLDDPDYQAEREQIHKDFEANKELGGDVTLALLLGEQFMTENGIEDKDATPLLMKVAKVANAEQFKNIREELAEAKLALKAVINHVKNTQTQQAKQQTESKVVTFIKSQLPDYDTNTKTQDALKQAFQKQVAQAAKETAELVGGDPNAIAQEMVKNPVTYNNLLRSAIVIVKPGSVKSVPRSGVSTGVASKPSTRRQPQSQKLDPRKIEPDWSGIAY